MEAKSPISGTSASTVLADKPTEIIIDAARLSGIPGDLTRLGGSERGQVAGAAVSTRAAKPDGLVILAKAHNVKPAALLKPVFQHGKVNVVALS